MLDVYELEKAIGELEARPPSLANCAKLADLYAVRDHMTGDHPKYQAHAMIPRGYSSSASGDSDFLRAVSGREASVWRIMDNLMDDLKVVNPRIYESVMDKIRRL